jgi:hypothetical protein
MTICLSGSAIRIQAVFRDFDGNLVDPQNVKVRIYDNLYKQLDEFPSVKKSTGVYYYDYVTAINKKDKQYFCEMSGDGVNNIVRGTFNTTFVL